MQRRLKVSRESDGGDGEIRAGREDGVGRMEEEEWTGYSANWLTL